MNRNSALDRMMAEARRVTAQPTRRIDSPLDRMLAEARRATGGYVPSGFAHLLRK